MRRRVLKLIERRRGHLDLLDCPRSRRFITHSDMADAETSIRFTTELEHLRVTDAPIQLPTRLSRAGLSEVVNHLLTDSLGASHVARPFDFPMESRRPEIGSSKICCVSRFQTSLQCPRDVLHLSVRRKIVNISVREPSLHRRTLSWTR